MNQKPGVAEYYRAAGETIRSLLRPSDSRSLSVSSPKEIAEKYRAEYSLSEIKLKAGAEPYAERFADGMRVCVPIEFGPTVKLLSKQTLTTNEFSSGDPHVELIKLDSRGSALLYPCPDSPEGPKQAIGWVKQYIDRLNRDIVQENRTFGRVVEEIVEQEISSARREMDRRTEVDSKAGVRIVDRSDTVSR